jgi:nucleotide-binding universal stress UspA family protein
MSGSAAAEKAPAAGRTVGELVAAGTDGYPEGRDAAALAALIAHATGGEVMLVAIQAYALVVMPKGSGWKEEREEAMAMLRDVRDAVAPDARVVVETDYSASRALERVVRREHRDLLVLGSSRRTTDGRVRMGGTVRQLIGDAVCAVAVAPRGYTQHRPQRLTTIGVGYDAGPEADEALRHAGRLAVSAGATLRVQAVVEDRKPAVSREPGARRRPRLRGEALEQEVATLRGETERAVAATGADAEVDVRGGSAARVLQDLSDEVDLLVIGSRRWGRAARVLLGGTGESLMHGARCPVMVVPRPR